MSAPPLQSASIPIPSSLGRHALMPFSFIIPIIIGCAQFMHQFDGLVIAMALPSIAQSLDVTPIRLELAITCYLLTLAVFVPLSGWLADKYGSKKIYVLAIFIFTTSSLMCGLSSSFAQLVLWRTIQGIGASIMTPVGRIIVAKSSPKELLLKAMTYITIPAALAPLLGPLIGGLIATYFSWQWIFYINVPIGIIGLIFVYFYIPDLREEQIAPLDWMGFFLTATAMATLVLGFESIGHGLFSLTYSLILLAAGTLASLLYVLHERRMDKPIINLDLLKIASFQASVTGGGLFYLGTIASIFLTTLLLQAGFGYTAFEAGQAMMFGAIGSITTRFIFRPVVKLMTYRHILMLNSLVYGLYLITCALLNASIIYYLMVSIFFIGGIARAMQFTSLQSFNYADVPRPSMSQATSFSSMILQLTQSFGVGISAFIIHLAQSYYHHDSLGIADIAPAFMFIGLCSLLSVYMFYRLPPDVASHLRHAKSS
jgi:EmrB/QacA subfamily drug resistance transporter